MGKKNAKALTSSSSKYQKEYGTSKLDLLTKTNLASGKLVNWLGINPPGFNFKKKYIDDSIKGSIFQPAMLGFRFELGRLIIKHIPGK